jgi:serine protease Do
MSVLEELEQAARGIAETAGGAIVGVGNGRAQGSGVMVADDRVLTNAHNLHGDQVTVTLADGRAMAGRVTGADRDGDLALVAVEGAGVSPIGWPAEDGEAGEAAPGVGAVVFALANPGGRGLRVSFGLVSATGQEFRGPRGRRIAGSIEHTAPLMRGSSGGALVAGSGRLVGLNTHRLGNGFYLALPADAALRARVDQLAAGDSPARPRLGIGVAPAGLARRLRAAVGLPERDGLLVGGVEPDSPAAKAGLRRGDLLVALDGRPLASVDDLQDRLDGVAPDATVELGLVRGADELSVRLTFGALPR